jgi:predicted TIM-barrel fold metal-dependent hydrolase
MASSQTRRAAQFTGVAGFQMNLINIIAAIIGAGVLERYPNLRIGLGESGIGWLPYALDRMDFEYEDRFRDLMKLKPSEYWRRQCRATFQFDRIGAKLVEDIGVETLMWGSDYPHPDGDDQLTPVARIGDTGSIKGRKRCSRRRYSSWRLARQLPRRRRRNQSTRL